MATVLVGDIGATKTWIALYDADCDPPRAIVSRRFATVDFSGLPAILDAFLAATGSAGDTVAGACFGVAGPVRGRIAQLTNVPWAVDADQIARGYGLPQVRLLNDVEALGYGVTRLAPSALTWLRAGRHDDEGNAAVIAAGTGLGETILHRTANGLVPVPSEAGHADFAARTTREQALASFIAETRGRVSNEDVLSGPGLVNIHRFTHAARPCPGRSGETAEADDPALITARGLAGSCAMCSEALALFVSALGAEAGNLALRAVATAGLFVGGGIPAKILPALRTPAFLQAFTAKAPMGALLGNIPVAVVHAEAASLLGAAAVIRQQVAAAPAVR